MSESAAKKSNFNFNSGLMRLQDPKKVAENAEQLATCQKLVSDAMVTMAKMPENGGNPFLFTFTATKEHNLLTEIDTHLPEDQRRKFRTACTDSISFGWYPPFLEKLTVREVQTIMGHEVFHIVFFHCMEDRRQGRDIGLWGTVIDYLANAALIDEHQRSRREQSQNYKDLWTWSFPNEKTGKDEKITPVTLQMYWDYIDGKLDKIPEPLVFADIKSLEYTVETLYDEFVRRFENSPRRCKEKNDGCGALSIDPKTGKSKIQKPWKPGSCPKCGAEGQSGGQGKGQGQNGKGFGNGLKLPESAMDQHVKVQKSRQEIMAEAMRAADQCKMLGRGEIPAGIEALLKDLQEPELSPSQLMIHALHRKVLDEGEFNDYTRYRRRPSYIYGKDAEGRLVPKHQLFVPKRYEHSPKWVGLVDTSGSMSDQDIADVLKECKVVARISNSEGWLVPTDATPYWDKAVLVTNDAELSRFGVVGRGGTVFRQFFEELPSKMGKEIDLVMVMTDGDIDTIPESLAPPCEVIWIIVGKESWTPPFGRAIPLRRKRSHR